MTDDERTRCPVCRARFRGTLACGRCGAELRPAMLLVARAWHARSEARRALAAGDDAGALLHATLAAEMCATRAGARLLSILRWQETAGRG